MMKLRNQQAEQRLAETRAFADQCGPEVRAQFEERLAYLENYRGGTCEVELMADFAPYSFDFVLRGPEVDGARPVWFNGGLIYYGPGQTGVGAPQFSVDLEAAAGGDPLSKHRWNIHT